jgi:hypothetical protein
VAPRKPELVSAKGEELRRRQPRIPKVLRRTRTRTRTRRSTTSKRRATRSGASSRIVELGKSNCRQIRMAQAKMQQDEEEFRDVLGSVFDEVNTCSSSRRRRGSHMISQSTLL